MKTSIFAKRVLILTLSLLFFSLGSLTSVVFAASGDEPNWDINLRTDYHLNNEDQPVVTYDFFVPLYFNDRSVFFFNQRLLAIPA